MSRHRINPHQDVQRAGLRLFGGILVVVGGIFTAVGLFSFFAAFGGGGVAAKFWFSCVGRPLRGFGTMLLKAGYMGSIARYVAGETAPVASDTLNYVARATKPGLRDAAGAIADGLRGGDAGQAGPGVPCRTCGHDNDADARFCDQCGAAMEQPNTCRQCRRVNDDDARFCDGCGAQLA